MHFTETKSVLHQSQNSSLLANKNTCTSNQAWLIKCSSNINQSMQLSEKNKIFCTHPVQFSVFLEIDLHWSLYVNTLLLWHIYVTYRYGIFIFPLFNCYLSVHRPVGCPEISLFHRTVKHSWASIPFGLITDQAKFQVDTPMAWFLELNLKKLTFEQNLQLFTDFAKRSPFWKKCRK